jgi:type II secretory pathway pseudopilin PulG
MEMAIVLLIVGLLLGGLLMPLQTQINNQRVAETQKYLDQIRDALLGYAAANGRLPCPATAAGGGVESPLGGGACAPIPPYNGFLPAVTLGLSPVDAAGYAVDAWGNRIRYAVTTANASAFTTAGSMRTTGIGALAPDLRVCASATGITATDCGPAANALTNNAVIVVYSLGRNAGTGGIGLDEAANPNPNSANNDQVFVSHPPALAGAANGEFDDIVTWLSPNTLYNRMLAAGALP